MAHHIHFPGAQPIAIGSAAIALHTDARVGTKQIDLSVSLQDVIDECLNVRFARDVRIDVPTADLGSHFASCFVVNVGDHHRLRTFRRKPPAQGAADAIRAAGDDDYFVIDFHRC